MEMCRHEYTRVTQFCGSCRAVTWSQLRGRGQATPLEEGAFGLNLRDEQGCGQMKAGQEKLARPGEQLSVQKPTKVDCAQRLSGQQS